MNVVSKKGTRESLMLQNENIVCLSNMHWDGHMTSKQQIMSRLAKQNRVLYVNRALTFLSQFSGNEEIPAQRQFKEMFQRPHEIRTNLFIATPPFCMPLRYSEPSYMFNSRILLIWLKKTLRYLGMENPIVWSFLPELGSAVKGLSKKILIYHCVDEHTAWGFWWNSAESVSRREIELLKVADLVIATSNNLKDSKSEYNSNCYFIPNAANFDMFRKANYADTEIPSDMRNISRPIIGYTGMFLPDLIDVDCIEYAAKTSGYSFVFIGKKLRRDFDLSRLEKLENVHFLGFKKPDVLTNYLKWMDVCIMPSTRSKLSDAVFPLKLFEYLSAGKPVVATRTKELEKYSGYIYLSANSEEFLQKLSIALKENHIQKASERIEIAKKNTWDVRVEEISGLIQETIKKRQENI